MNCQIICLSIFFTFFIYSNKPVAENTIQEEKPIVLEGNYSSLKGVMHHFSCYCFNGGKLTTDKGEVIYVCFADENIDITCKRIKVKGKYVTKKNASGASNPCPDGEMKYFEAGSYVCK